MRVISGEWRGRKLLAPKNDATRPTADRTRETLFSMLASRVGSFDGLHVADLFAGAGALGIEALSRGAAFALFVETDDGARGAIRENMDAYGLFGRCRVHRRSATDMGPRPGSAGEAFTLAFLDPPYAKGLGEQTLARLLEGDWLAPGAIVVFERGSDEPEIDTPGYDRLDARDYGAARVLFLKRAD